MNTTIPADIRAFGERLTWPVDVDLNDDDLATLGFDAWAATWLPVEQSRVVVSGRAFVIRTARVQIGPGVRNRDILDIVGLLVDFPRIAFIIARTATHDDPRVSCCFACTLTRGTHCWFAGLDVADSKRDIVERASIAWSARTTVDPDQRRAGRPRGSGRFARLADVVDALYDYQRKHGTLPPSKAAFARWAGTSVDAIDRTLSKYSRWTSAGDWTDLLYYVSETSDR